MEQYTYYYDFCFKYNWKIYDLSYYSKQPSHTILYNNRFTIL